MNSCFSSIKVSFYLSHSVQDLLVQSWEASLSLKAILGAIVSSPILIACELQWYNTGRLRILSVQGGFRGRKFSWSWIANEFRNRHPGRVFWSPRFLSIMCLLSLPLFLPEGSIVSQEIFLEMSAFLHHLEDAAKYQMGKDWKDNYYANLSLGQLVTSSCVALKWALDFYYTHLHIF